MSDNLKMLEDKAEEQNKFNCRDKCMVDGNYLLTNFIYRKSEKSKQYVSSPGL